MPKIAEGRLQGPTSGRDGLQASPLLPPTRYAALSPRRPPRQLCARRPTPPAASSFCMSDMFGVFASSSGVRF